jgi:hypothetical protein
VTSFPRFKWLVLVLLLAITLGWKVVARSAVGDQPTERDIQVQVAEFLVRQHFGVSVSEHLEEGRPSISASSGPCRMLIAKSPPLGWDRDLIRRYAEADDRVFVVFQGHVYADQPTFLTVFDSLWSRFRRELGSNVQASPVLAIVARPSCEAEQLPWNRLEVAQH